MILSCAARMMASAGKMPPKSALFSSFFERFPWHYEVTDNARTVTPSSGDTEGRTELGPLSRSKKRMVLSYSAGVILGGLSQNTAG